ncbi:hypothetical protein [uncultured Flavobacterium sp.]|uniref:hypothetical protein n=1 Tax=uncultured Flavobacterium sp. TaxID=165435 RepID=UPI0030C89CA4
MKITYFILFIIFSNLTFSQKIFEGELIYTYKINLTDTIKFKTPKKFLKKGKETKVTESDLKNSSEFYDTIRIKYKNGNYIINKNDKKNLTLILFDSLEEAVKIFPKEKTLIKFYLNTNREIKNNSFEDFKEIISKDTIYKNFGTCKYYKLIYEFGEEEFIINESFDKLMINKNILSENYLNQYYTNEVSNFINKSILLYYSKYSNNLKFDKIETSLVCIIKKEINDKEFQLPNHVEDFEMSKIMPNSKTKYYLIKD